MKEGLTGDEFMINAARRSSSEKKRLAAAKVKGRKI